MSRRAQLMNRMALDSARLQPRLAACATRGATRQGGGETRRGVGEPWHRVLARVPGWIRCRGQPPEESR